MIAQHIRTISVAIIKNNQGKVLAIPCYDRKKQEDFYRLLGGGVDFGETTKAALKREFKEELGIEIKIGKLLKVFENIFQFEDKKGHEICFIYEAELQDKSLYKQEQLPMIEEEHKGKLVTWVDTSHPRIYPINPKEI